MNKVDEGTELAVVVRCAKCRYYVQREHGRYCAVWSEFTNQKLSPPPNGYCYHGIKKEDKK